MTTATAGVWIAAILGFSAPLTAAIVVVLFSKKSKIPPWSNGVTGWLHKIDLSIAEMKETSDHALPHKNSARVDVIESRLGGIETWLKSIDGKVDKLKDGN